MAGKPVYGVTLYRRMARRWLERDGGKHHIRPDHKLRLASHLAAHLWRSGDGLLPAEDIERWFHAWLESEPDLHRRYACLHPDQLEEDLRTATFLSRQDGKQGSSFRFAHTSLLEFFLADYLLQALRDGIPERWAMERPSDETLGFLGQLLAEADDPGLLQTLQGWRAPYRPGTSELLLDYGLYAQGRGWPAPLLRGIDLAGSKLADRSFRAPPGITLDLSEVCLRGANLRGAVFERVRLAGADLHEAQLAQANLLDCDATGADWRGAECTAAVWRRTRLESGTWRGAQGYRPQFLLCETTPPDTPDEDRPAFVQPLIAPRPDGQDIDAAIGTATATPDPAAAPSLHFLTGHTRGVWGCAFSPDDARLLSAGVDGTLRLWDATGGETLLTLSGHAGGVPACAFSPDGARLLSAGSDGTLGLWDAAGGEPLLTLSGHEG